MKQYRNLIYDRVKQFYRNREEEEKIVTPGRITSSSFNSSSNPSIPRHQSNEACRNRANEHSQHVHPQNRYSQAKTRNSQNVAQNYTNIPASNQYSHNLHEVTRKSSLKDILKNKSLNKSTTHSAYNNNSNYSHEPVARYNPSGLHSNHSPTGNCFNYQSNQSLHAQKYYRKNTLGAAIYKENKLGRHI